MYILALIILAISVYIFCSKPGSALRRWFAAFLFFVAAGVLSIALYTSNQKYPVDELAKWCYYNFGNYIYFESDCFMPYTLLVFSIIMTGKYQGSARARLAVFKLFLLLPIIVMHIATTPVSRYMYGNQFYILYASWSLPYYILAPVIAFSACMREKDKAVRLRKTIAFSVVLLISVTTLLSGYALPLAYGMPFYGLLQYLIIIVMAIFVIIALRYGILGLKLRIEREHYNAMTGSMTSGAALLGHSIKNEINKIAVCTDNIRRGFGEGNPFIDENIGIIDNSVAHLSGMTQKIRLQMQGYELKEASCRLIDIAEEALKLVSPLFIRKKLTVARNYEADIWLFCDRIHLCEVLANILTNAAEAVSDNGTVEISIVIRKQRAYAAVRDNGRGISQNDMPFIFNPFFTTKKQGGNYGLGLSYCYGVMKKHGGSITINSFESGGTEVRLGFPRKKIVRCQDRGQ